MPKTERFPKYIKAEDITNSPFNRPQLTAEEYIAELAKKQNEIIIPTQEKQARKQARTKELYCCFYFFCFVVC